MIEIEIKRDLSPKGQKNIIENLLNKLSAASFRLECGRKRTIINIDDYDETIIYWALQEYYKKIKE